MYYIEFSITSIYTYLFIIFYYDLDKISIQLGIFSVIHKAGQIAFNIVHFVEKNAFYAVLKNGGRLVDGGYWNSRSIGKMGIYTCNNKEVVSTRIDKECNSRC